MNVALRVLGVHGAGEYRPNVDAVISARRLTGNWAGQLAGIAPPGALDVRVAYYAHHLRTAVAQGGGPDGLSDLPPDVERMIVAWADELGALPAHTAQGPATVPIRWLVDRVAETHSLSPGLAAGLRRFVGVFFREVAAYLRHADGRARRAARDSVASAVAEHRPAVLLAHSLGSVVAYETLLARPELRVPLFVTLGSPLGMPGVVYERLQPAQPAGLGIRPPNVRRWVNVADPGDVIAIPRPFTRRFTPDENHEDAYIHPVFSHVVDHYLRAPETVRAVRALLRPHRPAAAGGPGG